MGYLHFPTLKLCESILDYNLFVEFRGHLKHWVAYNIKGKDNNQSVNEVAN